MPPRNNYYAPGFDAYGSIYSGIGVNPYNAQYGAYGYNQPIGHQAQTIPQPMQQPAQPSQNAVNNTGNSNTGFIPVKSREEAEQWPVAPGASVTFKDESKPYQYYSKSRGLSQFDEAVFESYHLVKDGDDNENNAEKKESKYALKDEFDKLLNKVDQISEQIGKLTKEMTVKPQTNGERMVSGNGFISKLQ